MTEQLSLFATGIVCWYCANDPGMKNNNGALWSGFFDADTQQRVCMKCRKKHYAAKCKTEFANMYSEMPIVIETVRAIEKFSNTQQLSKKHG